MEENKREILNEQVKGDLRTFFLSQQHYTGTYHHHKETMAWAATALYLGGLGGLAALHLEYKIPLICFVLFTFLMVMLFVRAHFTDRSNAASIVAACISAATKITDPGFILTSCMVKPKDYKDYGYKYPKILCDEIDTQTARRKNERHESWVQLVTLRWCKIPRHEWYEWAPYGVLIAWTLAFIIMIWLRPITTGVNTFS